MAEQRIELTSETKVVNSLADGIAKDLDTPIGERFIEAGTIIAAGTYNTGLREKISELSVLETDLGEMVLVITPAGEKLRLNNTWYLNEMNGHIILDDNPKSVRGLFHLNESTGNLPNMESESAIVTVSNNIKTGNEAMVTNGTWVLNTGFPASAVISRRDAYNVLLLAKSVKKDAIRTKQNEIDLMLPLGKAVADDMFDQIKYHYRNQTEAQIRDACRGYGVKYETVKPLTEIIISCFDTDGVTPLANVLFRIGEVLTKDGKIAKEGVKGTTNINGELLLKTTTTGDTSLIGKLIGKADNITALTIVSEKSQAIIVKMQVGDSSL